MSDLLLLFQQFGETPPTPSGVYTFPLSGVVMAEYPAGMEQTANLSGYVSEEGRISGTLGAA